MGDKCISKRGSAPPTRDTNMVDIANITDAELEAMLVNCAAGGTAYTIAREELDFRARHPEYQVAA